MEKKNLLKLFLSMLSISTFTFGGGFTIIPLMEKKFAEDEKWIDKEEMLNLISIAQSTPGAIVINAAILVGYYTFGILGAVISVLGATIPPLIIISIVSVFYNFIKDNEFVSGFMLAVRATVSATIFAVVIDMIKDLIKKKNIFYTVFMVVVFIATAFFNADILMTIVVCIAVGIVYTYYKTKKLG